ncbi:MAG: hypothetical protein ACRC7N_21615 [Clostridium sp.]
MKEIKYYCLVMSKKYIENHFSDIKNYASVVEERMDDSWCTKEFMHEENAYYLEMCKKHNCNYTLIDDLSHGYKCLESLDMSFGKFKN